MGTSFERGVKMIITATWRSSSLQPFSPWLTSYRTVEVRGEGKGIFMVDVRGAPCGEVRTR